MINNLVKLQHIEKKILSKNNFCFEEIFEKIDFELTHKNELRYFGHLKGKYHFIHGNYYEALSIFQNTLDSFGPHIGLLCDFAFSTMLVGDYIKTEKLIQKIRFEFENAKKLISSNSKLRTLIFLGKICMEWCLFEESIAYYAQALSCDDNDGMYHCLAQIGMLRIKSFIGLYDNQWKLLYGEVLKMPIGNTTLNYEKVHALFLSDIGQFGLNESLIRAETLINTYVIKSDLPIIGGLITEQIILNKSYNKIQIELVNNFLNAKPRDGFEKSLQLLFLKCDQHLNIEIIQKCLDYISIDNPLGQFRILFILYSKTQAKELKKELKRNLTNLIMTLSKKNQNYIMKKWPSLKDKSDESKIFFEIINNKIYFKSNEIKLPQHTLMNLLIRDLVLNSHELKIENELLIYKTWNEELNSQTLEKLKVNISRINSHFQKICGMKIFIYSKCVTKINPQVIFVKKK